jgi:hypothetical protein
MMHDFIVGARPVHENEMLRLGLRQLAESELLLRKLLQAYKLTHTPHLASEIACECVFISQTIGALMDLASQADGGDFMVSGNLLKISKYLSLLVEDANRTVGGQGGGHAAMD